VLFSYWLIKPATQHWFNLILGESRLNAGLSYSTSQTIPQKQDQLFVDKTARFCSDRLDEY
jgi:hypothetical protein